MTSKYRARATEYGGRVYSSRLEARYAQLLDLLVVAGEVEWWEPQIQFTLPWAAKHKVDFLVCFKSCGCRLVEVKGMETREARERRKALEWFLGEPILVVKAEDVEIG